MTNKYKYFVANWKMFGNIKTLNSINKVLKLSKLRKFNKAKIIYCPPYTLLAEFTKKLKNSKINVGAQNCHFTKTDGPYTGSISSKMIKSLGCKYVIIGHSENRIMGDSDFLINKKIESSLCNNLKVLFCIGESLKEKKLKKTKKILSRQLKQGLKKIKNVNNIFFAYEPVWSIGTGKVPNKKELENNILFIKKSLRNNFKSKKPIVLYGGSVSSKSIKELIKVPEIDGFLIGGASQNPNKFINIIKKYFN